MKKKKKKKRRRRRRRRYLKVELPCFRKINIRKINLYGRELDFVPDKTLVDKRNC